MTDLSRFKSKTEKVVRHGQVIEVEVLPSMTKPKRLKRSFKIEFVKLPNYWIEQLMQSRHLATYKLAHHILREAFKQEYGGGREIVLSSDATGLPRATRLDATKELVKLKLIQIQQNGNQAVRVTKLFYHKPK